MVFFYGYFTEKLNDPEIMITGSIVIMCCSEAEVKYVTGYLTQANIRCTEFDEHYSGNQISKCHRLTFEECDVKLFMLVFT